MDFSRIHEEAFSVEGVHFKKTKKRTNPKKADPFLQLEGDLPILVAAPHSVRYISGKELKRSDIFTGAIAYLLNSYTGCHTLAVKKLYGGDPDSDEDDIFKNRVRELVGQNGIKLLLDFQGASDEKPFDVNMVTFGSRTLLDMNELPSIFKRHLKEHGIARAVRDHENLTEMPGSIIGFASTNLGITALRLEITRRYRAPNGGGTEFNALFAGLAGALDEAGELLK